MPIYEYYGLRGLGDSAETEMPSGIFRVVRTEDGLWYENITWDGKWRMDNELIRYFAGYGDEAEKITKEKADKFIDYLKSGQAAIDKGNEEWK